MFKSVRMAAQNKLQVTVMALFIVAAFQSAQASVKSYKKDADGVTFSLDKGLMKIKVCSSDIIEVKYTQLNAFDTRESLVVNNKWLNKTAFTVTEGNGSV